MIFSVIIPICNGEEYLESCVDSALGQTLGRDFDKKEDFFEIILVENGSADNSPAICDALAQKKSNVRCIHRGKIGLYAARQEGIKEAKGEWIVALDADDIMLPGCLNELYEAIERHGGDSVLPDMVLFNAADMDAYRESSGGESEGLAKKLNNLPLENDRSYSGDDKRVYYELLCQSDAINAMWIKCVRKNIAIVGDGKLFLNYGEDIYQSAHYIDSARAIVYLDKVLYLYRDNASSLTSSFNERYFEEQKIVWKELDSFVPGWKCENQRRIITERKSITCTIAVVKIIYSGLPLQRKKKELRKLMADPFYKEFAQENLPEWAPEEDVFVHGLQVADNSFQRLVRNAFVHGVKVSVKKMIR